MTSVESIYVRRDPREWEGDAACLGMKGGDDFFFPDNGPAAIDAAKWCVANCSVREDCLEMALDARIDEGVFGGTTARERRKIIRARAIGAQQVIIEDMPL